jgi:hypothetical protein
MRTGLATLVLMFGVATTTVLGAQYPNVSPLIPFSARANYMSLPGFLRYLEFQRNDQWLPVAQAKAVVLDEKGL